MSISTAPGAMFTGGHKIGVRYRELRHGFDVIDRGLDITDRAVRG